MTIKLFFKIFHRKIYFALMGHHCVTFPLHIVEIWYQSYEAYFVSSIYRSRHPTCTKVYTYHTVVDTRIGFKWVCILLSKKRCYQWQFKAQCFKFKFLDITVRLCKYYVKFCVWKCMAQICLLCWDSTVVFYWYLCYIQQTVSFYFITKKGRYKLIWNISAL